MSERREAKNMFTMNSHYNPYLGAGHNSLRLILSLSSTAPTQISSEPHFALAIVLDNSTSMIGAKIQAAREGAARIVQLLDTAIIFMIVSFCSTARVIYGPTTSTEAHKQQALQEIQRIGTTGGTCMSTALHTVIKACKPYQQQARTMLFLTDGQNTEEQRLLHKAVNLCAQDLISIHAWGIGADWDAAELRYMAEMTHGSADIIPTLDTLETASMHTFQQIRRTTFTCVRLQLWTPAEVAIKRIQRVFPTIVPLSSRPDGANQRQQVVSLGSFAADEQYDYLIELTLPIHEPGQRFIILRPSIRYSNTIASEQEVRAPRENWVAVEWTTSTALAARIDSYVAHYTNEHELAERIQQGIEALKQGHRQHAAELLLEALDTSLHVGNEQITALLNTIVMRGADGQPQLKNIDDITRKTLGIKQERISSII
jgi:uncharacterized protein YegL